MEPDNTDLRLALLQTLENYQRCGVKWVHRQRVDQLPSQWLDVAASAGVQEKPPIAAVVQSQPVPEQANPPRSPASPNAGRPHAVVPHGQVRESDGQLRESPLSLPKPPEHRIEATGGRSWTRPALDDEQRLGVFAQLDLEIRGCRLCREICGYRRQTVFGIGPIRPKVCFMGEAPGADEDQLGEPFVGRAGQLLTKIIEAMTLKRQDVYILNSLKCRPPANRTPTSEEVANCRPFVEAQLETLQPQYIVCLGLTAVRSLLNLAQPIGQMRGKFFQFRGAKVVVTYHPSYLLRTESAKKLVWDDMQMLMRDMGISRK